MRNLKDLEMHPIVSKVVKILSDKTQNTDLSFFNLMVSYYLAKIASMMRVKVMTQELHAIPVNMYCINLAVSGSGKGKSIGIIEDKVINRFKDRFMDLTFPSIAEDNLYQLAAHRANKNPTANVDDERQKLETEFYNAGHMVFSFDSATSPAIKQLRYKLLLAGSGSMNMEIDEIGSNFTSNTDALNIYLELFDMGKVKQKLVKNTKENARGHELFGQTPANMLLFGTPTKLLDGAKVEQEFMEMLETGYARRCFFGFSRMKSKTKQFTAEEIFDILSDTQADDYLLSLGEDLAKLADQTQFNTVLEMPKGVALQHIDYRLYCERKADKMSDYEDIRKAELKHRYFKVAKLAGVYAFIDKAPHITEDHLYYAIALAEESGQAFERILRRDRPYARLASYICSIGREVTHADLVEDLPFYKGSESQKKDMMTLAIAHAYKTNRIIRTNVVDGIEFISGNEIPETDLNKLIVSYSHDMARDYHNHEIPWPKLEVFAQKNDVHWANHRFAENPDYPGAGYRSESYVIPGFNVVVLDIDDGTPIQTTQTLLEEYTYFIYTTKRHTQEKHRYRLVMPISHTLELNRLEYKGFMENLYAWLPFHVDEQTNQRSRKWLANKGTYHFNEGELLDALQFIPKTKKAEEYKTKVASQTSLNNLQRWFINHTEEGNRNNQLAKYAFALCDMNLDFDSIKNNVLDLNSKLDVPLSETEILSTVMQSVARKLASKP